jgi:predicted transposase/invertase (TIGR01784 family)
MTEKPQNPHDQFFKEIFSQHESITDFVENYLPARLTRLFDLPTIERIEDSFVDNELKEHLSDLLFRVKLKTEQDAFIYILLEHKSSPDRWVSFQLLRYLVRIFEKSQREGGKKLPLVLPIVFYHGKTNWNISEKFSSLFDLKDLEDLREFLPEFSYHLCDLNKFDDDELKGNPTLLSAVRVLKYIFRKDLKRKLSKSFEPLAELLPSDFAFERLKVLMFYLIYSNKANEADIVKALKEAQKDEMQEVFFIDRWIQEGRDEGLQQGEQLGKLDLVLQILKKRFGEINTRVESRIQNLPLEKLEKLGLDLFDFKSKKDLTEWLKKNS